MFLLCWRKMAAIMIIVKVKGIQVQLLGYIVSLANL